MQNDDFDQDPNEVVHKERHTFAVYGQTDNNLSDMDEENLFFEDEVLHVRLTSVPDMAGRPELNTWQHLETLSPTLHKFILMLGNQNVHTLDNRTKFILCNCRYHASSCLAQGQEFLQCISCHINDLISATVFPCIFVQIRYPAAS